MSDWTKERIEKMIADGVEESLNLDYKRAAALSGDNKVDITKDVSAFANSSGGTIIYGVAETPGTAKPERIDPVVRTAFSRERLENIIQTIQPLIEGYRILPVTIDERAGTSIVVEIPQSTTAHQARDHKYHKRHNFTTLAMEDYEIRDVMNRRKHPKIGAFIYITSKLNDPIHREVLVKLVNAGQVIAHAVQIDIDIPINIGDHISFEPPAQYVLSNDQAFYQFSMNVGTHGPPLFPQQEITLRRSFRTVPPHKDRSGLPVKSLDKVRVKIFADEMPALAADLILSQVLTDWTKIG